MTSQAEDIDAIIEASVTRLFIRHGLVHDRARRNVPLGEAGYDPGGWKEIQEAGLTFAMLEERHGGVGMKNGFNIARLAGANALPFPLCETMAANWLLAAVGLEPSDSALTLAEQPLQLQRAGGGWRLSGEACDVPWGRSCGLVALAAYEAQMYLIHCSHGQFATIPGINAAGEPRDLCKFDCAVTLDRIAPVPRSCGPQTVVLLGAALRSAQIAGAGRAVLIMAVDYARERRQFGRAIGGFQAVQQLLATMATHAAAARAAADLAIESAADGLSERPIAAAKVRAGEAAGVIAAVAHQVVGAIGFTREHPLHTLTHRLWSWRDEFGGESAWATTLGRQLAEAGGAALWSEITAI